MMKPLCFLDVDGVINACPPVPEEDQEILFEARGYPICFTKGMSDRVKRLAQHFDMVWLTTWEHTANDNFIHYFIEPNGEHWPYVKWRRYRWKMAGARKWMERTGNENRPFVQIDDDIEFEHSDLCLRPDIHPKNWEQEYLYIQPDLGKGLTDEHVDEAIEWAESLK